MIIRQQAFGEREKLLKGGLHCHTTRSDGKTDPAEAIRLYCSNGYDFAALTDHRIYNYQNFAPEVPLTIIPAMEYDNTFERLESGAFRTFHTVVLGREKDKGNPYEQDQRLDTGTAIDQEGYQAYLDEFHKNGQLTIHCHPQWSSTPARYFEKLEGTFALEVHNSACAAETDADSDNGMIWEELLDQGKKIYAVASDDAHRDEQYAKSWVRVNADNNVDSILDAFKAGKFYASTGPEIYDFYVEDGAAHIKCSEAENIVFRASMCPGIIIRCAKESSLTEAEWQIRGVRYVRAVVTDKNGKKAWTNPIFLN